MTGPAAGGPSGPIRLGLLGAGIGRSMAPAFHVRAGELVGLPVTYDLLEQPATGGDRLAAVVEECRTAGYRGLNVTYPFKELAASLASIDDPGVAAIGAVNTLLLDRDGQPLGRNTDHSGLVRRWRQRWPDQAPGVVGLLGAGGVGRASAFALADLGASAIRAFDVDRARAVALRDDLVGRHPTLEVSVAADAEGAIGGADGIVNGTPVGMYIAPGCPVDPAAVGDQTWLFDAVYSPLDTPLVRLSEAAGLRVLGGFELFLGQAVDAFEAFTGVSLPGDVAEALEDELWRLVRARQIA